MMRILNLYAGIGGNRSLWGNEHQVDAYEIDVAIAEVYKKLYPDDKVIALVDAHEVLLEKYNEYDFIWSSPPCTTHSRARYGLGVCGHGYKYEYPDLTLYQEIILLSKVFKGRYCVENVLPYYNYLIEPSIVLGRHAYWCNFHVPYKKVSTNNLIAGHTKPDGKLSSDMVTGERRYLEQLHGIDLSGFSGIDKRRCLRNMVEPEIGKYILDCAVADISGKRLQDEKDKMALFPEAK
jgi:DNA (cytosine-5)-methyltransferase 1